MSITGAILSGGKNKRMKGRNKAFMEINGVPIIERTIALLQKIFNETMIVTNANEEYTRYADCTIINDKIKDSGPLGGIHAALDSAKTDAVFFVSCDMPFLHNDMILGQIDRYRKMNSDILVPRIGDKIEPLHGIYAKTINDKICRHLKDGSDYSIKSFLASVNPGYMNLEDTPANRSIFRNINTPEDLERAVRWNR